jgi:hypothetical protein
MVFIVFTGLVSEVCFFHRATPCANIVRPFRAGGMWGVFTVWICNIPKFHRATPCANIVRPFRAGGMWGVDCCGLFLRFGFVVCQLQTGEIG